MFTHVLLAVDGSPLSEAAFHKAIAFARDARARTTALRVAPNYHVLTFQTEMLTDTRERFTQEAQQESAKYLQRIAGEANAAGVTCDTVYAVSDHPYEAIIKTAEDRGCDLIVMASHGRRGVQGLLIGSETLKVLTHSKIPVLVYR
ncbi:universal stress protein [Cupriavidus basilensis]|uniref:universal stress protein n=1 Tax=Cupriavidus basilensis TaxID=68895 RepID=UPI0023E79883|nr:universal stress protein [Cupriavidus basilensis]MDF3881279.1 universal stress protein [Cupriavidus basilensis]MDF3883157.1 universal stress protein [Cupriavidus basilensis]